VSIQLFIDTNVFLSFYHLTSEDLEELRKLAVLVERQEIQLLLPEQVHHELRRNRDGKIADALKGLRSHKFAPPFPQMCKDYAEYGRLRDLQRDYDATYSELLAKLTGDISRRELKADSVIDELFDSANIISSTPEIVQAAKLRVELGNPPGKNGSFGDAVNWEALLASAAREESLHFVTDDKDYWSPLEKDGFSSYLMDEWVEHKSGELISYRKLSAFFKSKYPEIELASEIEKDLLIRRLASSSDFLSTHMIVSRLSGLSGFTLSQAEAILSAAVNNSQVAWIARDQDVSQFLTSVMSENDFFLDGSLVGQVMELTGSAFEQSTTDDDAGDEEEIPF